LVLFIHPHFTYPGGAGKFVLETADRLAQRDLDVVVLTLTADNAIVGDYKHVKFHCIGGPLPNTFSHWLGFISLARRIEQAISQLKPDILFPQVFPANYWGFLYKRRHRDIPCIWYCHDPNAFVHNLDTILGLKGGIKYAALISNPFFQWLDRELVGYADRILVNSQYTAGLVKRIYHRPATVVYPGVDTTKFKPSQQKEEFFFTISRLTKFKKVDLIIKALASLKQEGNGPCLIVGGDGEEKTNLMNLAHKLKLSQQVQFVGRLLYEDVSSYLAKAKFAIFPSTNEPFGLVPLEAMACGTPVIVSNSGGPKETVIEGETGLTFEADSQVDLANKIQTLWGNVDLIRQMSLAARKHVAKNFSWDNTVDILYQLFTQQLQ
jgi:glycosyltransferase involved in cell wall biosynthesis